MNLKSFFKKYNINISAFASQIGLHRQTVTTAIKKPKEASFSTIEKIKKHIDKNYFNVFDYNDIYGLEKENFDDFLKFFFSQKLYKNKIIVEELRKELNEEQIKKFSHWLNNV